MKLIEMRPEQVRDAVRRNVPLLIASGVVEYHGPHLPVGTDFLIVSAVVEEIERRTEVVVAPPFPLGPTGSWAGGAEDGEIDFPPQPFFDYVKAYLGALLGMGFKRIFILQHHQGLEGAQALCIRRAVSELALEEGRSHGVRWGRLPKKERPPVFDKIKVLPPTAFLEEKEAQIPWGHASFGETSFMLGVYRGLVEMGRLPEKPTIEWLRDSHTADARVGRQWFELCVESWVKALNKE